MTQKTRQISLIMDICLIFEPISSKHLALLNKITSNLFPGEVDQHFRLKITISIIELLKSFERHKLEITHLWIFSLPSAQ